VKKVWDCEICGGKHKDAQREKGCPNKTSIRCILSFHDWETEVGESGPIGDGLVVDQPEVARICKRCGKREVLKHSWVRDDSLRDIEPVWKY